MHHPAWLTPQFTVQAQNGSQAENSRHHHAAHLLIGAPFVGASRHVATKKPSASSKEQRKCSSKLVTRAHFKNKKSVTKSQPQKRCPLFTEIASPSRLWRDTGGLVDTKAVHVWRTFPHQPPSTAGRIIRVRLPIQSVGDYKLTKGTKVQQKMI